MSKYCFDCSYFLEDGGDPNSHCYDCSEEKNHYVPKTSPAELAQTLESIKCCSTDIGQLVAVLRDLVRIEAVKTAAACISARNELPFSAHVDRTTLTLYEDTVLDIAMKPHNKEVPTDDNRS